VTADRWSVERGDAVESLAAMPSESVDLVLTDYAYESLEKHRARGTTTRLSQSEGSSNPWFTTFPNDRVPKLLDQVYRVLRPQRHAWMLCDDETADLLKTWAPIAGLYVWNVLVWLKTVQGTPPGEFGPVAIGMGYHGRRCTERIVFLEKRSVPLRAARPLGGFDMLGQANTAGRELPPGKGRKLRDLGMPEVIPCPGVRDGYPTEKPVWLLRRLIEQSTEPGEMVVDPFCGGGSTGEAALRSGRRVKLYDIAPTAIDAARARLQEVFGGI
jgi:site-specific DNA-methyltransferase (adenine-specific)